MIKRLCPALLLVLTSCAGPALRHAYKDYSEVYAESLNRQLLLNLARLSNDEPPYFIQLGQINSQFTFNTSLGFSPSQARVKHPSANASDIVQDTLTLGGTVSAGAVEAPTFQFVPLNGDAFAQAINNPISDKLFYTLYDQGFHADLLVRTMVASVRYLDTNGEYVLLVNHPYNPSYLSFLRFCEGLRDAQLNRDLLVKPVESLDPPPTYRDVKLADALAALSAGYGMTNFGSNAHALTPRKAYTLKPNGKSRELEMFDAEVSGAFRKGQLEFQLRTFIATMYAVAREEVYFKFPGGNTNEVRFSADAKGLVAAVGPSPEVSSFQVRPILTLTGFTQAERSSLSKVIELDYHRKTYTIGDDDKEGPLKSTHNRSVFSLLAYLFAQIAIDPQKLPVQQLIQVR